MMKTASGKGLPASNGHGFDDERLKLFQKTVLGGQDDSGMVSLYERNLRTVRITSVAVILINSYWLIINGIRENSMGLFSVPALVAIGIQLALSVYMLILPRFTENKAGSLVRYSFLVYYIGLILAVMVLAVVKNERMVSTGTDASLAGISLSTFYLFILLLAPLPSARDSFILGGVLAATLVLPVLLPGREIYSLAQQTILRLCMIIVYWHIRDVNMDLARSVHRLSVSSFTDPLTKVLNRRSLDSYWETICGKSPSVPVGVIIFDIDDFKKYNDHYTHIKGDEILIRVCRAAISVLDKGSFLFRYGGEEFVVLLPGCTQQHLIDCACDIRKKVYETDMERSDDGVQSRVTVTIGCSLEEATDPGKDYIINADRQLYAGKNSGKNCVASDGVIYR